MSPNSPKPDPKPPADPSRDEPEAKAIETFSFEASAGSGQDVKDPETTPRPEPTPRSAPAAEKQAPKPRRAKRKVSSPTRQAVPSRLPTVDATAPNVAKPVRRGLPSWAVSLAVHAALLLLLSFYTLVTIKEEELGLYASTAAYEEVEDFQEVEIDPSEDIESLESDLVSELSDPGEAAFGDLSAESALADVTGEMAMSSDSLGDLGNLFGDTGDGLSDMGEGAGGATASFFGTKVEGNRIVYVLDNSGGMRRGQLETLVAELLKSVESLTPKQQFYIIFYSDALYPLFYPNAPQNFVRANDKNKQLLRRWLDTVEFCLGNVVDEAVRAALTIRPDVVYLLTDGDLDGTRDQRRMKFLLHGTGGAVPIHTILIGTGRTDEPANKLKQVAEANGGTFRAVNIESEARELARTKDRPYHNKEPGPVWGHRVKAR